MKELIYKGIIYHVDKWGFLTNPKEFTEDWMQIKAYKYSITMTPEHRQVVYALRSYYNTAGVPPLKQSVSKITGIPLSQLTTLFPGGVSVILEISGMPSSSCCK